MLAAIGCIALFTLGTSALVVGPPAMGGDGLVYNFSAVRLLNTGIYSFNSLSINAIEQPDAFITPGYVLVLAFIYLFLPHATGAYEILASAIPLITFMHFVCAIATVVLISATAQKIAGLRLGWIAGILAALYLPFGAESMSTWPENVGLLVATACLFLSVGLFESPRKDSIKWMVGLGVCGGVGIMMRPVTSLLLLVPICFWGWKHRDDPRRTTAVMFVGCLGIVLVMTPWIIRNEVTLGKFIPLTTHAGTVWIDSVGGITLSPAEQAMYSGALAQGKDGYQAVAFNRLRAKWKESPPKFIAWKLGQPWVLVGAPWSSQQNPHSPPAPDGSVVIGPGHRVMSEPIYDTWTSIILGIHRILLVLAVAGTFLLRRRPVVWLIASGPLYYIAVHTVMLSWTRYFYPAMPAVILLASIGVGYLVTVIADRVRGSAGASAA